MTPTVTQRYNLLAAAPHWSIGFHQEHFVFECVHKNSIEVRNNDQIENKYNLQCYAFGIVCTLEKYKSIKAPTKP